MKIMPRVHGDGGYMNLPKGGKSPTGLVLTDWILNRLTTQKKNCLLCVVGEVGIGKSYASIKLAESIMRAQGRKFDIENNVFFNTQSFISRLSDDAFKPGDVIILEEVGVEHSNRKWYDNAQILFNFILQTFRNKNLCVLMTTPDYSFIDTQARKLTQGLVHCTKRNKNYVEARFLRKVTNPVSGQIYEKYLRYKMPGWSRSRKLGTFQLTKPSPELVREYERLSQAYKNRVIQRAQMRQDQHRIDEKGRLQFDDKTMEQKITDVTYFLKKKLGVKTDDISKIMRIPRQTLNNRWKKKEKEALLTGE